MLIKLFEGLAREHSGGPPRKPLKVRLLHWSVRRASAFAMLRKVGIQEDATGTTSKNLLKFRIQEPVIATVITTTTVHL